jgi:hypothetical protein
MPSRVAASTTRPVDAAEAPLRGTARTKASSHSPPAGTSVTAACRTLRCDRWVGDAASMAAAGSSRAAQQPRVNNTVTTRMVSTAADGLLIGSRVPR